MVIYNDPIDEIISYTANKPAVFSPSPFNQYILWAQSSTQNIATSISIPDFPGFRISWTFVFDAYPGDPPWSTGGPEGLILGVFADTGHAPLETVDEEVFYIIGGDIYGIGDNMPKGPVFDFGGESRAEAVKAELESFLGAAKLIFSDNTAAEAIRLFITEESA